MKNRSDKAVAKFWDQFIDILRGQGIKEESARWYVMRAEHYLAAFPDQRLADHSASGLTEYFQVLGRKKQLKPWQFQQSVDAIQILFCQMVRLSWAESFDWAYWKSAGQELKTRHPTIARNRNIEESVESDSSEEVVGVLAQVRSKHPQVFSDLLTEIRKRDYSIRTEQAYEAWVCRYIAFHDDQDPRKMGEREVVAFLEYLAVKRSVAVNTQPGSNVDTISLNHPQALN